jgi:hypothetical protein
VHKNVFPAVVRLDEPIALVGLNRVAYSSADAVYLTGMVVGSLG